MVAGIWIAEAVKCKICGQTVDTQQAQVCAERTRGGVHTPQHCIRCRRAIRLPAKPSIDELAFWKSRRSTFDDLANGEGPHRRVQGDGCTVIAFVIGPSALSGI